MRTLFVDVKGGLGMNISCARVIQSIQRKISDIKFRVLSPYWDIFSAAGIDYYRPEEVRDFIFDAKSIGAEIIEHRIYDMSQFIYKELNYKTAWLKLFGFDENYITDEEYSKLELFPNFVSNQISAQFEEVIKNIPTEKFMLVQFYGGQSPLDIPPNNDWSKKPYDYEHEPLKRHYPINKAQSFINLFQSAHKDITLVQYSLPNEPLLEGCLHFVVPYLMYYLMSKMERCVGAVTIDSSLAHLITGNTKVLTIWGHSLPDSFGYSCNKDVIQDCRRDEILYFTQLGPSGAKINYVEPAILLAEVDKYFFTEKNKASK